MKCIERGMENTYNYVILYICMYVCMYVYIYVSIYIYIYTHIYIYINIMRGKKDATTFPDKPVS